MKIEHAWVEHLQKAIVFFFLILCMMNRGTLYDDIVVTHQSQIILA